MLIKFRFYTLFFFALILGSAAFASHFRIVWLGDLDSLRTQGSALEFEVLSTENQTVSFAVDPEEAGVFDNQKLMISNEYFAKAKVIASSQDHTEEINFTIQAKLNKSNTPQTWNYQNTFTFKWPSNSVNKPLYLELENQASPPLSLEQNKNWAQGLYRWKGVEAPDSVPTILWHSLNKINLSFHYLEGIHSSDFSTEDVSFQYSNQAWQWTPLEWSWEYWGVQFESEKKTELLPTLTPNPFSPLVIADLDGNEKPGTRLDIQLQGDAQSLEWSVSIYSPAGYRVRELIQNQNSEYSEFPKTIYFDGLDDQGNRLRNGRYTLIVSYFPVNKKLKFKRLEMVVFK